MDHEVTKLAVQFSDIIIVDQQCQEGIFHIIRGGRIDKKRSNHYRIALDLEINIMIRSMGVRFYSTFVSVEAQIKKDFDTLTQ